METANISEGVTAIEARRGLDLRREGDRYLATDDIAVLLEAWCGSREYSELSEKLIAGGVSWGPYQSVKQALDNDWRCSTENPLFEQVDQPGIGTYLTPGSPLDFGATPRETVQPAPSLGQHTDEILSEILGLSGGEITSLHDDGIVGGR